MALGHWEKTEEKLKKQQILLVPTTLLHSEIFSSEDFIFWKIVSEST
jgi:hypothetical protein